MRHRDRADGKVLRSEPEQKTMAKADKGQFDELLRRMVSKNPQKNKDIRKVRVRPADEVDDDVELRKNPETDPAYLPVFDFKEKIRIEHKDKKKKD